MRAKRKAGITPMKRLSQHVYVSLSIGFPVSLSLLLACSSCQFWIPGERERGNRAEASLIRSERQVELRYKRERRESLQMSQFVSSGKLSLAPVQLKTDPGGTIDRAIERQKDREDREKSSSRRAARVAANKSYRTLVNMSQRVTSKCLQPHLDTSCFPSSCGPPNVTRGYQ